MLDKRYQVFISTSGSEMQPERMTLSQTLVQQHGGIIECDSHPGRTEFLIRLPIARG